MEPTLIDLEIGFLILFFIISVWWMFGKIGYLMLEELIRVRPELDLKFYSGSENIYVTLYQTVGPIFIWCVVCIYIQKRIIQVWRIIRSYIRGVKKGYQNLKSIGWDR